ncbi:MAG: carboxymuconolactone decarboxylase family protein [Zoogloeaceae bacterium]|nr:carboxymuconolactone decarboxylase family protein [Zoogloeaceae bacterium]
MNRQTLNARQQAIVPIAAFTARGDLDKLKGALNEGLDAGMSINEIKEVLVQMYAYTGFPRSLNAINTLIAVLEERQAKGISDKTGEKPADFSDKNKYNKGRKTLETLSGRKETKLTGANAFAPAIDEFLKEHLFADIFGRGLLTHQERELATISALSALDGAEPQLNAHKTIGKNAGLTETQINELSKIVQGGQKSIYPRGNRAPAEWFSGVVWLNSLASPAETEGLYSIGQVTFEAGGRTHWHTHPIGQILLCTEGKGWYQERGKPARALQKGDVVVIPKEVEHWHGAAADSQFVHIAITNNKDGNAVTWLNPVTNEEYGRF